MPEMDTAALLKASADKLRCVYLLAASFCLANNVLRGQRWFYFLLARARLATWLTDAALRAGRAAAKDSGDEADAEKVIAAVAQHEDKKLGAAPSVSETAAGEGKSDKAESIPQKR
jgi:hypothetical protein